MGELTYEDILTAVQSPSPLVTGLEADTETGRVLRVIVERGDGAEPEKITVSEMLGWFVPVGDE